MKKMIQQKVGPAFAVSAKASLITALALAGSLVVIPQVQAQSVIAHWSFDTSTLSYDGSGKIIGASDATLNHNAFVDTTTGTGTANGGVNPSGAFAGSDSVTGAFGQGLMFNGNNYLEYPELTELMGANVSFSVSFWLNLPSGATPNSYSTMSDWGNAASDGTSNSKYVYSFGPNADGGSTGNGTRFQIRTGTGNGSDLLADHHADVSESAVNDGSWHMYTWTYDAANNGEVLTYFDGAQVGDDTSGITSSAGMAIAAAAYGTFGFKGDSGSFIPTGTELDEAWVFNRVLDPNQIDGLHSANNINAVPEPGALAFLGLGLGLFVLRRFRCQV